MQNIQTRLLHVPEPRPVLPYYGSKAKLSPWLWKFIDEQKRTAIALYPQVRFTRHVCVFGGDFRNLIYPARGLEITEYYNDRHKDNVNLLIALRDNPGVVFDRIEAEEVSEDNFRRWEGMFYPDKWIAQNPGVDVPIAENNSHRAACYLLFARFCFNGAGTRSSTGLSREKLQRGNKPDLSFLQGVSDRLQGVIANSEDYRECVAKHARWCRGPADLPVFIYDPPYPESVRLTKDKRHPNSDRSGRRYKHEMLTDEEHQELCETILKTPGLHVLSGYDYGIYNDMLGECKAFQLTQDAAVNQRKECLWSALNRP